MRSDFLNSIPVQCNPIRPPSSCLLTLLVAHITGAFGSSLGGCETLNELKKVNLWLQANKLSLNIKKTHDIILKTRRNKIDNIIVKIDDTEIKQVESTKFLPIYIDSNLTWKTHIKHITTKIAKTTGILFKARHFIRTFSDYKKPILLINLPLS